MTCWSVLGLGVGDGGQASCPRNNQGHIRKGTELRHFTLMVTFSAASLGNWTADTMTQYPSNHIILEMLSTMLGSNKYEFCKSLV